MGFLTHIVEDVGQMTALKLIGGLFCNLLLYLLFCVFYNIRLHPLAGYPGSMIWTATYIPYSLSLIRGTTHLHVAKMHERYGPVVRISPTELSYITAQAWNDIYARTKPRQLPKNPFTFFAPPTGVHGLGTTPVDKDHARIRRELNPGFSERRVKAQEGTLRSLFDLLISKIKEEARAGQVCSVQEKVGGGEVNLMKWLQATTFDIVAMLTFGESVHAIETGTDWISLAIPTAKERIIVASGSFYAICHYHGETCYSRNFAQGPIFSPFLRWFVPNILRTAASKYRFNTLSFLNRRLARKDAERADFITSTLPNLNTPQGVSVGELHTTARTLMLAGSETTASVLTFACYFALINPTAYANLKDEIRNKFETEEAISISSVNGCKYLLAFLEETMRIWPAVPFSLTRMTLEGDGCVIDGREVPGGSQVGVNQWAAFRSEQNFKRPLEFLPERWLAQDEGEFKDDKRNVFQPFSVGPRNCVGRNVAYAEMRVIFALLLWNFDMELLTTKEEWEGQRVFLIWEKCPLRAKVTLVAR